MAFPALDALREGYDVYPVVDAIGGTSEEAHRAGLERVVQAGAQPGELGRRSAASYNATGHGTETVAGAVIDDRAQGARGAGMTTAAADRPARIRELLLANLFAVFGERDPERRLEVIARNYTEDVIWQRDRRGAGA